MTDDVDLIKEAQDRLRAQEAEQQEATAELGEVIGLDEHGAVEVRWRGEGTVHAKRDGTVTAVDVYLVWDTDGAKRFLWPKTTLRQEIEEQRPNIGDRVAIVRGQDI